MKGRKPIPNAIKKLTGDGVHDSGGRKIGVEPQSTVGAPPVPDDLTGDVRKAYRKFAADLDGMGVLTHADRGALIMLAQAWTMMQTAAKDIQANGAVVTHRNGETGANKHIKAYLESAKLVKALLTEFGLTPSARSRFSIAPEDTEQELEF